MPATSPYSGNDYQAASNYRPFQMPINDIFKAVSAQNSFWEIGARKVKAVYDNALSLDLTLDANKEVKKKFMEDADKQLNKLSSMNLSDPSVQRQGFNIYKPLLQDKAVMYDNELTKTMRGIYSDANSYRTKKLSTTGVEGEGYTDRNLAYALDGFENFNSKLPRDPDALKNLYDKLGNREYSPYYDAAKEYPSILKNCKGSATEKQDVATNYMYFDNYSKSGANSSETANCFMMGLSEKAKSQIGIDGWAYYKGNPQLLADDHRKYALGAQEAQVEAIKGKIAAIKTGGINDEEKVLLKELEDALPTLQSQLDTRKKEYNTMIGGNALKYVTDNFQVLSKGIYLGKTYQGLGEAFKSDETSRKLTANASGIAQYNALQRMYQDERQHGYTMEEIKLRAQYARKLKQDAGEIPSDEINPLNPVVTSANDTGQDYGEMKFNVEKEMAFAAYSTTYETLKGYMNSNAKKLGLAPGEGTDVFMLNFAEQQSKKPIEQQDKQFKELMDAYNNAKDNYTSMDMRQKAVNAVVENEMPTYNKILTIGGVQLTFNEAAQVKNGATIRGVSYLPYDPVNRELGKGTPHYIVNGRAIASDPYAKELEKLTSRRDIQYRKMYYDAKNYISPRIDPDKNPNLDNQIKAILGVSGGNNQKNGYKLIGHDRTGKDMLVIPLDENSDESSAEKKLKRAQSQRADVDVENIGGLRVLRIPNMMPAVEDIPTNSQLFDINKLRDFQTLMEAQFKNKGAYISSEDLKNSDGTVFPYGNVTFKTARGKQIKVKAIKVNNQTKLLPSVQLDDGSWDDNYPSFTKPEELVLSFRTQ